MFRTSAVLSAVLFCASASAQETDAPPAATYVLLDAATPCPEPEAFLPFKRTGTCAIAWGKGRSARFDAIRVVGSSMSDHPIRPERLPLYLARRGREWFFATAADYGPAFRDVWEYAHVVGSRYWIAHRDGAAYRLTCDAGGWYADPVVGPVRLALGLPYFVLQESMRFRVYWGESDTGPFDTVPDVKPVEDALHLALSGFPEPIEFVPGED